MHTTRPPPRVPEPDAGAGEGCFDTKAAATALHDANNVLATIALRADLLLEDVGADHPARQHVEAIVDAVDRGSALIRRALPPPGNEDDRG